MRKGIVGKIIFVIFLVSIVTEVAITVSYALLSNMDVSRFENEMNVNIINNK